MRTSAPLRVLSTRLGLQLGLRLGLRLGLALLPFLSASARAQAIATGFEGLPAGAFESIETGAGTWSAARGHAQIDAAHHRGGSQCLHLVGGEARRVVLDVPTLDVAVHELSFWCERWTRRDPFQFRIEQLSNGSWREIYRGTTRYWSGPSRATCGSSWTERPPSCASPALRPRAS